MTLVKQVETRRRTRAAFLMIVAIVVGSGAGERLGSDASAEGACPELAEGACPELAERVSQLFESGIPPGCVLGVDSRGVPLICGTPVAAYVAAGSEGTRVDLAQASGLRWWETIPGVIRNDGVDTFRVEVGVSSQVQAIQLEVWTPILAESGLGRVSLRDDGQGGDRTANDLVYTSERLRFDTRQQWQHPLHYQRDTNSPTHISIHWAGPVSITELNGFTTGFVQDPQVGVLSASVPLAPSVSLGSGVAVAPHLVNVQTTQRATQNYLRLLQGTLHLVTTTLYGVFPDAFDLLVFFSADHIERLPYNVTPNFNAGLHHTIQVNYSGTGQSLRNEAVLWGNPGRLLGINIVDSYERGIAGYNVTHEILHQWSSYTATPLSEGSHYAPRSNVASLLGGYLWTTNANGSLTLICEEGREGATHAAPLDKYMMGLITGAALPSLRVYSSAAPGPYGLCNQLVPDIVSTVTAGNIQALHGARTPGPATAKRDFSIGFVVETYERLLNPVEMTFYEILAEHYTKSIPLAHADPYVGRTWPSITRYFGEGTSWRSDVLSLIQPVLRTISRLGDGRIRILGTGYPGRSYSLRAAMDLESWTVIATRTAAADGTLEFITTNPPELQTRFFRLALP